MQERLRSRSIPKKKDAAQLWEYALRALGRRALSTAEIRQKLKEKAIELADVEPVMAKLAEYGYLNDERFAESFASSRRANQGLGRQRVLRDLRGRRVGSETASQAVEKIYADTDEVKLVREYMVKKFRNRNLTEYLAEPKHLASAYRKLRYAGFSSAASVRVLKSYSARAEELEGITCRRAGICLASMKPFRRYPRACLLLTIAAQVGAQETAPRHELAFTLGKRLALTREGVGAARLDLQSGNALQANYGYRFTNSSKAALFGELHFLATPLQRIASSDGGVTRDVSTIFATPGLRLKFAPGGAVSPFVAIGAGWALFEQSTSTIDGRPNPAPRTVNRGVVAFGGGVDVRVWRWLAVRAEIRDFYAGSPAYNVTALRGGQHNVVIGGGFVLRFR